MCKFFQSIYSQCYLTGQRDRFFANLMSAYISNDERIHCLDIRLLMLIFIDFIIKFTHRFLALLFHFPPLIFRTRTSFFFVLSLYSELDRSLLFSSRSGFKNTSEDLKCPLSFPLLMPFCLSFCDISAPFSPAHTQFVCLSEEGIGCGATSHRRRTRHGHVRSVLARRSTTAIPEKKSEGERWGG